MKAWNQFPLCYLWFKYDLDRSTMHPVWPDWGSNPWTPDHDQYIACPWDVVLTTRPSGPSIPHPWQKGWQAIYYYDAVSCCQQLINQCGEPPIIICEFVLMCTLSVWIIRLYGAQQQFSYLINYCILRVLILCTWFPFCMFSIILTNISL